MVIRCWLFISLYCYNTYITRIDAYISKSIVLVQLINQQNFDSGMDLLDGTINYRAGKIESI